MKIGFEISAEALSLVQFRQAVVPPPGAARSDTEIIFDLARRLGLGEQFFGGLLVDAVGEVLKLPNAEREAVPINLDRKLAGVSAGVHRLDGQLLVILDIDRVLDLRAVAAAA